MRVGQLAKRADVSPDTIRHYEKMGLLSPPARTRNHYRDYGPEALDDVLFIKKAQASGLKLDDVRDVMQIASRGLPRDATYAVPAARQCDGGFDIRVTPLTRHLVQEES